MRIILTHTAFDLIEEFEDANEEIRSGMRMTMFRALSILEAQVKQNIRIGSGLKVQTGTLLNSIQTQILNQGFEVIGRVGPSNVPYAEIHEEGGILPARFIKPRLKTALMFKGPGGLLHFSKGHWLPATNIPARPYLRPAMEQHADRIQNIFGIFIDEALEKN